MDDLLGLAFHQGPGAEANTLIDDVRREVKAAQGRAINYEVLLDGKGWDHVREVVAPRLALYLKEKGGGVAQCGALFLSLFRGGDLYFVWANDFFAHYRLREGLSEESFAALATTWERTGRPVAGALPPLPSAGSPALEPGGLRRLVGQLLVVGFEGRAASSRLLQRIATGQVGGVVLFARNIASPGQVARLNRQLRAAAPRGQPLLVGVDQEGGRVQRLREPMTRWPPMARLGQLDDVNLTEAVGEALGQDLAALGFNLDFAPVLDVVTSLDNTVIGDRSFGADPELVARHGMALAQGLLRGGVLPCGKHFPGHGGPVADSHHSLPLERRSLEQITEVDLLPFKAAVAAGLPLLMTAHVLYESIDHQSPGTLSWPICHDLLRQEVGFQGALISDDLEMKAISGGSSAGEAALRALMSGVDLLLMCEGEQRQLESLDFIVQHAENDEEVRVRLLQAAARVSTLRGMLSPGETMDPKDAEHQVTGNPHRRLLEKIL